MSNPTDGMDDSIHNGETGDDAVIAPTAAELGLPDGTEVRGGDIYCPWCTDGLDVDEGLCGQPGCKTTAATCDCDNGHPGILWPWGSAGAFPPALPYVEACSDCQVYETDDDAADALVKLLLEVGCSPLRGEHIERDHAGWDHWVKVGRPVRRVGIYVFPSPQAIHRTYDEPTIWAIHVAAAQSSITNAARHSRER